jgi:DNA-binding MarR family transcriptional regulator
MATQATPRDDSSEFSYGMLPQIFGYHLRRTQVAVFRHFAKTVAVSENITPGLLGMLQVIAANPGLRQGRLAEAMEVDRSTIVKVVDQLEGRGLIARRPSPTDKRSHSLTLTAEGGAALKRIETLVLKHEDEFTGVLSTDERHVLIDLLTRLYRQDEGTAG